MFRKPRNARDHGSDDNIFENYRYLVMNQDPSRIWFVAPIDANAANISLNQLVSSPNHDAKSFMKRSSGTSPHHPKRYTLSHFPLLDPTISSTIAYGNDSKSGNAVISFTLQDVWQHYVLYRHDGSESTQDSMVLQLQLIAQPGYLLPSYLQVGVNCL